MGLFPLHPGGLVYLLRAGKSLNLAHAYMHSTEEDKQLIEAGIEYMVKRGGFKIYRKRK
jgi:hypothetical protein